MDDRVIRAGKHMIRSPARLGRLAAYDCSGSNIVTRRFTRLLAHVARGGRTCLCLRAPTGRPSNTVDLVDGRKNGKGFGE